MNKILLIVGIALAGILIVLSALLYKRNTQANVINVIKERAEIPPQTNLTVPPSTKLFDSHPVTTDADVYLNITSHEQFTLPIKKGKKVTWINDNTSNSVVVFKDNKPVNPVTLKPGEKFSYTFNETGYFPFEDKLHPGWTGLLFVR